jgi:hypothetical protein
MIMATLGADIVVSVASVVAGAGVEDGSNISISTAFQIVRRVRESLTYLEELDPATRDIVRGSYETALQATFWFSVVVSGLCLFSSLWIKEKPLPAKK